ncbi:MAG: flagellar biosynthetic protein FliO [Fibrobacterota bacterium]
MKQQVWCVFFLFFFLFSFVSAEFDLDEVQRQTNSSENLTSAQSVPEESADPDGQFSVIQVVGRILISLLFLSILIYAVVWGIKKSGLLKGGEVGLTPSFELLEQIKTGTQGQIVFLLRFEDTVFILGQTGENISLIKELSRDESRVLIEDKRGEETVGQFQKTLHSFVSSIKSEQRT